MLSTSFVIMLEEFEGPYGNYILEKGLLHVNYVLKRFLVETTLLSPPNSELRVSNGFPRKESNHFRIVRMGVRHSPQTPGMEHTFIIKTTICCICSIDCLYYFLQLENNGKMMKERMPCWHDE